jgi:hypothetical protein
MVIAAGAGGDRDHVRRQRGIVVTLGSADADDEHLAGRIVAVDDEIVRLLAARRASIDL